MTDLGSFSHGVIFTGAVGINNLGQVIAVTPTIPEPASYVLMLAGLGMIGFMARRKPSRNRIESH
jgi:hypothetical protein